MPLTNPYNPYSPYASYLPNQFQPTTSQLPTYTPPAYPANHIFGRPVSAETEIKPNEVPMDGTIALFPLTDFSVIIAKQWSQDGTIKTLRFVPDIQVVDNDSSPEVSISELAHSMDERFNKLESMIKYRNGGKAVRTTETKDTTHE